MPLKRSHEYLTAEVGHQAGGCVRMNGLLGAEQLGSRPLIDNNMSRALLVLSPVSLGVSSRGHVASCASEAET